MTATAGTPAACTATIPDVAQHIDGDRLTVTVDFTGPDVLVRLSQALRRVGLMHTFAVLGHSETMLGSQLRALDSEPSIHDALTLTLDPRRAEDFRDALDDATVAGACERCRARYAVSEGMCTVCQPQVIEP